MKHLSIYVKALLVVCTLVGTTLSATAAKPKDDKGGTPKGYKLSLTIVGNQDSVMYLGNYYAGNTYAIDTAVRNKKGAFVFERKDRTLMPGLYFFTNPDHDYVEFMIYHETPNFTFTTREEGWAKYMTVKGSKENEYFFDFQRANREAYESIDEAQRTMDVKSDEYKAFYRNKIHELDSIKEKMIADHPKSLLALMMNATREPYVPSEDSTGRKLTDRERWNYYMDHYFDFMRLDDDAIVRTPDMIFHKRIMDYMDQNLKNATAEIVCEYVDKMIERSRPSKETFKYLVHTVTEKYLQSNIMSYDAVYVHLVKKYMESGDCFWMSPSVIDENVKRANTWDKLLIGKPAPPLIMKDDKGEIRSLYALKSRFTLLVFWSPTCGHCKTMIPELYQAYEKYKDQYDIQCYAILSEPDDATRPKWHNFIEQNGLNWINLDGGEANIDWHEVYDIVSTPQIYLLDRDKKILAKKMNAKSFESIIQVLGEDSHEMDDAKQQ